MCVYMSMSVCSVCLWCVCVLYVHVCVCVVEASWPVLPEAALVKVTVACVLPQVPLTPVQQPQGPGGLTHRALW